MTPEEIRKQMMGSAGLDIVCPPDSPAANATDLTKTAEVPEEEAAADPDNDPAPDVTRGKRQPREKSILLALVLALFFGPFGLFYVSWKRALAMLLIFIVGVSLIPKNGFVVLLLWLVAPILSIFLLGVGKRQPPPV